MRALVFHNPTAGANGSEKEAILSALKLADIDAGYVSVKKPGWEKSFGKNADLIVAAGGDGTIGKIMRAMPDRSVPVAILPLGTANNAARSLGIAGTPQELVETWKIDHTFPLNLGAIKGVEDDSYFLEAFGVGLFGEFLRQADKGKKAEGADNLRKGRELLQRLVKEAEPVTLDLMVDGKAVRGEFIGVEIMNLPFTGPGLPLAPKADAGDGKLDAVCFKHEQRKDLIEWLEAPHEAPPPALIRQGEKIEISWQKTPHRVDDQCFYIKGAVMHVAKLSCDAKPVRVVVPIKHPAQKRTEQRVEQA